MNYADDFIINKTGDKRSHSIVHDDDVPTDIFRKQWHYFSPSDWKYLCTSGENVGAGQQGGSPGGAWGRGHESWGASTAPCPHCPGRTWSDHGTPLGHAPPLPRAPAPASWK